MADGGGLHTLYLSRLFGTPETKVWESGRSCDVLWNEDSSRLAITDWTGSNIAEIFLIDVTNPGQATRLEVKNTGSFAQPEELEGHIYWEALKWEDARQLKIRCFGHTDEARGHGFAYYLLVDTQSGMAKLLKKFDEEDGGGTE